MSIAMIVKVFSDCCICFAILGAFPSVLPYSYSPMFPALLCALAAGLGTFFRQRYKNGLSRICAALPFLALLFAANFREMFLLFPVILYTAAIILWGELQLEYYTYRQFFLRSLILLGLLCAVLSTVYVLETKMGVSQSLVHPGVPLHCTLVHLVCGVILQRQLRLGLENHSQGEAGQIAAMLGGPGLVILGVTVFGPVLRDGIAEAYQFLIGYLFSRITVNLTPSQQDKPNPVHTEALPPQETTPPVLPITPSAPEFDQAVTGGTPGQSLWWIFLVAAVLLVALGLMLLSFRRTGGAVLSSGSTAALDLPEQETRLSRRSNRGKVRQLYREFLRQERRRGLNVKGDYTSADILQRISPDTNQPAAARLRDIYIRARYDETHEVSRAQVEAAKAALKHCRDGNNTPT